MAFRLYRVGGTMTDPHAAKAAQKVRVFVSYSRVDAKFVDALVPALELRGYDVCIDRFEIRKGEDWWKAIVDLIVGSTLVIFVMSPNSLQSKVCADEVDLTKKLGKRIVPLMFRERKGIAVFDALAERDWIPFQNVGRAFEEVAERHFAWERAKEDSPLALEEARKAYEQAATQFSQRFIQSSEFADGIRLLVEALELDDILWSREQADWLKRAVEWDRRGRPDDGVMRASEITAAQSWANRRPATVRVPEIFYDFLNASLNREERDRAELNAREQRISQRTQRLVAEAARHAREEGRYSTAMRIALSGEPSEEERLRGIKPEPMRLAELAAAAHASPCVVCLSGHSNGVHSAVFSPDGARVLTASADKTARVWHATTGAELVRLAHDDKVLSAAFSIEGARILTRSGNAARVWHAELGAELVLLRHDNAVNSARFSPDGARVLTASADKSARVWDAKVGAELARLLHDDPVKTAEFSPDGTRIVTTSEGSAARVWNASSGAELVGLLHGFKKRPAITESRSSGSDHLKLEEVRYEPTVKSAVFSPDGAFVLTCCGPAAWVWHVASGTLLVRMAHDFLAGAAFSPDGTRVLTQALSDTVLWTMAGTELHRWTDGGFFCAPSFSPDGTRVIVSGKANSAPVWDAIAFDAYRELARFVHDSSVSAAAFSPDGTRVVTAALSNEARVWVAREATEVERFRQDNVLISSAMSPDWARLATVSCEWVKSSRWLPDKTARLWQMDTGAELARLGHEGTVSSIAFNPDGTRVVTASDDKTARVWDVAKGVETVRLIHDSEVWSAAFSPDGSRVVTTSKDKTARVWDAVNGIEIARLAHNDEIGLAAFTSDGARVVTIASDKTIQCWESNSGAEIARFAFDSVVSYACISIDGARLATASGKAARIWDLASGQELLGLAHNDGSSLDGNIATVEFSPDGTRVVSASDDKTARVWDATTGAELVRFAHDDDVNSAEFCCGGTRVVTTTRGTALIWDIASGTRVAVFENPGGLGDASLSQDGSRILTRTRCFAFVPPWRANLWDATWAARLTGDALVCAVARARLVGEGRLTEEELRILRPILGEVDPDVVSRWLEPSPDPEEAEIEAALGAWRRHREMALALARKDWAGWADWAARRYADAAKRAAEGASTPVPTPVVNSTPSITTDTTGASALEARHIPKHQSSYALRARRVVKALLLLTAIIAAIVAAAQFRLLEYAEQLWHALLQ